MDGYEALAFAIVCGVVREYRNLRRKESRSMDRQEAERHRQEVERVELWFSSDYGQALCYGKGEILLERLKRGFE